MRNTELFRNLLVNSREETKIDNTGLKSCPEGRLSQVKRKGEDTFFQVYNEDGIRKRKAINKRRDIIEGLVRKEYLKANIQILEQNISGLERLIAVYVDPTVENTLARMPKRYQKLARLMYSKGTLLETDAGEIPVREAIVYHIKMERYPTSIYPWVAANYQQSDYNPEGKRHKTSFGLKVRSKSELMIAEKLYENGIPFRYEEVIEDGEIRMIPDFIMPDVEGNFYIWEHCGMPNEPKYMARHKKKMDIYERLGFVPWKNLIVTYDDEYGNINMEVIKSEIENRLL